MIRQQLSHLLLKLDILKIPENSPENLHGGKIGCTTNLFLTIFQDFVEHLFFEISVSGWSRMLVVAPLRFTFGKPTLAEKTFSIK